MSNDRCGHRTGHCHLSECPHRMQQFIGNTPRLSRNVHQLMRSCSGDGGMSGQRSLLAVGQTKICALQYQLGNPSKKEEKKVWKILH